MKLILIGLVAIILLASLACADEGDPMIVMMGSVTNGMWPIGDVAAMERTATFARGLGVDAFETYMPWIVFEPAAPDKMDWTETDKLDTICRSTGLKWQAFVMFNPSYATPQWYRESGEDVPHKCLEHDEDSDVRSIWTPGLEAHIERVMGAMLERYQDSPALESVMFGVSGDFGESIYPAGAVGWNGQYHNHAGFWCAEGPARKAFRDWIEASYDSASALSEAWETNFRSFDEVEFILPDKPMSDARWLDQSEWYRGEMTDWCEHWFQIARRHVKPELPLYLCVGGGDSVPLGFDITGQARLCAEYNVWLRLTNEGSNYNGNFMGTRQLTTAAKLYGVPSGLEPAGNVDENGVVARIFGTAAAGCNHIHYYEGQVANFNACSAAEGRTVNWEAERDHLVQKTPYVNVAAFYPRVDALCKRQMGTESLDRYNGLRDYLDFDFVDDNLAGDRKLGSYRYLLLGPCETMEDKAYEAVMEWVEGGGVLIAIEQPSFRTWTRLGTPAFAETMPFAPEAEGWARVPVEMPEQWVIHPGNPPAEARLVGNWSHPENDYRWGGKDAALLLPVDPTLDYTLTYEGGVPVGGVLLANGVELGQMQGGEGNEHSWTFQIPSSLLGDSVVLRLDFKMQSLVLATDSRELCVYPRALTLTASGGNPALDRPTFGKVEIDREKLAASTFALGEGLIVGMQDDIVGQLFYPALITSLLSSPLPMGAPKACLPDKVSDGIFVTCRGDEILVYNSNQTTVDIELTLPEGAELDRGHLAAAAKFELAAMAPNSIEAFPLMIVESE